MLKYLPKQERPNRNANPLLRPPRRPEGRGGDDDGEGENRTGATVSAAALHALGSAGEACAFILSEVDRQETALPQFTDGGSRDCQATHAAARGDGDCQWSFVAGWWGRTTVWF